MKTEVIMQRPFMGHTISQKSKSGLLDVTELVKVMNLKRKELDKSPFNLSQYLNLKSTTEFIQELQQNYPIVLKKGGKGRNSQTWAHPLLFMDIALAIDSKLKVHVYEWLYDNLLANRNNSGESYKKMTGALYFRYNNKKEFPKYITQVANNIRQSLQVADWQNANQDQLLKRDKIHENIAMLCNVTKNTDLAVQTAIREVCK